MFKLKKKKKSLEYLTGSKREDCRDLEPLINIKDAFPLSTPGRASSVEENQTEMEFKSQGPLSLYQHCLPGNKKKTYCLYLMGGEVELRTETEHQRFKSCPEDGVVRCWSRKKI